MSDVKQFAPTPAGEWSDPNPPQDVELPSGRYARIKKPNLYILGRTGQVPAPVEKAQKRRAEAKPAPMTPDAVELMQRIEARAEDVEVYVNWVMTRAFLEPRVSADGAGDTVPVSALTADDKTFVIETLGIEV